MSLARNTILTNELKRLRETVFSWNEVLPVNAFQ